jgi:NADP-dependent 3-hydroxy acid dehydrogenase YdfG
LSPGGVKTEFAIAAGFQDINPEMLKQINQMPLLESEDIADAVLYSLGTPPHVQVGISLEHETSGAPKYSNCNKLDTLPPDSKSA